MSHSSEKTVPTQNHDSSPTTANIEAFTRQLVTRINTANNANGSRPTNSRPYPDHDNPDHNSLHRYILDPRNTAEVLRRISDSPNGGEIAETFAWMLRVEEIRLSIIAARNPSADNEESARLLVHSHFQALVELGIFEYVTPQSPRYTPYTADSPEPEPRQPPISIMVTTSTTVVRDDDHYPPPYARFQRVDPATLTPSEDEETILPVPPPRPRPTPTNRRRGRRSQTPLLYVGLSGGHINPLADAPPREHRNNPQPPPPSTLPTRQQFLAICWECHTPGHTHIHCDRFRCHRCWTLAPGHRPTRCPHYRSEVCGVWGNHAWNNSGRGGPSRGAWGNWGSPSDDYNDDNIDEAGHHNIDT